MIRTGYSVKVYPNDYEDYNDGELLVEAFISWPLALPVFWVYNLIAFSVVILSIRLEMQRLGGRLERVFTVLFEIFMNILCLTGIAVTILTLGSIINCMDYQCSDRNLPLVIDFVEKILCITPASTPEMLQLDVQIQLGSLCSCSRSNTVCIDRMYSYYAGEDLFLLCSTTWNTNSYLRWIIGIIMWRNF